MFVVLFEVEPRAALFEEYLATAASLRPELERIEGFLENVRYTSRRTQGRLLSVSTWQDEKALVRWRSNELHYVSGQCRGRAEIFADYRLRVGELVADSRSGTVEDAVRRDVTTVSAATAVTTEEWPEDAGDGAAAPGGLDHELYDRLGGGVTLLRTDWPTTDDALAAAPVSREGFRRCVRVIRDYGMRDRREAPQYFPDVG